MNDPDFEAQAATLRARIEGVLDGALELPDAASARLRDAMRYSALGGGTRFLSEYGQWKGPGHNGMLIEDGTYWIVYHAYDSNQIGVPKLRIESLSWDADGWPVVPSQSQ